MTSIDELLTQFRKTAPGSPRLTWYGTAGDRIELSGKVFDNWVAKTANFLTEEFDFGPGSTLTVALPAHWKSLCIVLAALACGGTVSDGDGGALLASSDQERINSAAGPSLAVALGALALRWDGELPSGAQDYAAEVRMFADAFDRFEEPTESQTALALAGREYQYQDLTSLPATPAKSDRIALSADRGFADIVFQALTVWQSGGSIVLAETPSLLNEKLLASEGARTL